jgi:predicted 3-demethylubiquinone-9 3-methyltransferase (glyoxalase superfamily)
VTKPKIIPCLWYDGNAEEAARFYATVLPGSSIDNIVKAPSDNPGGGKEGQVLIVEFTIAGQRFTGLNGGPFFKFNEAVSFQIDVADQAEYDRLTEALSAVPEAEQCGWVKDRFGLSWQLVPRELIAMMSDRNAAKARAASEAMMQMKRLDIAAIRRAFDAA